MEKNRREKKVEGFRLGAGDDKREIKRKKEFRPRAGEWDRRKERKKKKIRKIIRESWSQTG